MFPFFSLSRPLALLGLILLLLAVAYALAGLLDLLLWGLVLAAVLLSLYTLCWFFWHRRRRRD